MLATLEVYALQKSMFSCSGQTKHTVLDCLSMTIQNTAMVHRSLTGKVWMEPTLSEPLNASHILAHLCCQRDIDPERAPSLISPTVFPDLKHAQERIEKAVKNNERIGLFGDYDCDGVTATLELLRFFERRGMSPFVRLPHRIRDGYGLHEGIVEEMIHEGVTLLITADTGIASVKPIHALKEAHIDTIITDHHRPQEELPPAYAIIHPTLSAFPPPHPCGAGVVFTLIHALENGHYDGQQEDMVLAMMATIADLVDLKGANRSMVQLGLKAFERITHGPLASLRDFCTDTVPLTSADIAYKIAPRINAAGRMDDPMIALRALREGGEYLQELSTLNEKRQDSVNAIIKDVIATFDIERLPPLLMTVSSDYPHGILGLIAGKLTETFGRPSLVAHTDGTRCIASLRSPSAYNLIEGLQRTRTHFETFGGHAGAAGCTFLHTNRTKLLEALSEDIESQTDTETLLPTITPDACITPSQIDTHFVETFLSLEPFGAGNPEPRFLMRHVPLEGMMLAGKERNHLRGTIGHCNAIGFHLGHLIEHDGPFDIICRIGINTWHGKKRPQIVIEDMRRAR